MPTRGRDWKLWLAPALLLALTVSYLYGALTTMFIARAVTLRVGAIGLGLVIVCFPPVLARLHRYRNRWLDGLLVVSLALAGVLAITSRNLSNVAAFTWVMIVGALVGYQVLRWLRLTCRDSAEQLAVSMSIGLVIFSLITMALSMVGLLTPSALVAAMLALTLLCLRHLRPLANDLTGLRRELRAQIALRSRAFNLILLAIIALCLVILYIQALSPELQFDANYYHLAELRTYLEHGRLIEIPYSLRSYFPKGYEMLFMLGMALGDQTESAAKLLSFVAMPLTCLLLFAFGQTVLRRASIGVLAAALFCTIPLAAWSGSTTYIDLALTLFGFAAVYAYLRWREQWQIGWLGLVGGFLGFALSIKIQAGFLAAPLTLLILIDLARLPSRRAALRQLLSYVQPGLVVSLPWYLISFVMTGNPIYPLYNGIFHSSYWPAVNTLFNDGDFGIGTRPFALATLFWNVTFHATWFLEPLSGSVVFGIVSLIAPLWFLIFMRGRQRRRVDLLLALITVSSALIWALTLQNLRYLLFALPMLALLAAGTFQTIELGLRSALRKQAWLRIEFVYNSLLVLILMTSVLLTLQAWSWIIPQNVPVSYALGQVRRDDYLSQNAFYPAAQSLARSRYTPKVLAINNYDNFHFPPEVEVYPYLDASFLPLWLTGDSLPSEQVYARLQKLGITHILALISDGASVPEPLFNPAFIRKYLTVEKVVGEVVLLKVRQDADAADDAPSLPDACDFTPSTPPPETCLTALESAASLTREVAVDGNAFYRVRYGAQSAASAASLDVLITWQNSAGATIGAARIVRTIAPKWQRQLGFVLAPDGAVSGTLTITNKGAQTISLTPVSVIFASPNRPVDPTQELMRTVELSPADWHDIQQCIYYPKQIVSAWCQP